MASRLSLRSFGCWLRKAEERSLSEPVIPDGIPREMAFKFLQVMKATDMSEIEDISDEDIVFMLSHGEELSEIVENDNILSKNGPLKQKIFEKRSVLLNRRVL